MTTQTKHTPGPWVSRWDTTKFVGQAQRLERCLISTEPREGGACFRVAEITGPFGETKSQAEANARLIAAAPELLKALNYWLRLNKGAEGDADTAVILSQAVIAKCNGSVS